MTETSPILPVYAPPPLLFERGEGLHLYTKDGERYLDFIAGIAVNALGHAHPALVSALTEQAGKLWHLSNMFQIESQRALAERYTSGSFADFVFFTNSGSEAIETALKIARRHHWAKGDKERIGFVAFEGAFHGRATGAIAVGGQAKYREGFEPLMPGVTHVGFGDHDALDAAVTNKTAAVIIEPVQGEGGLRSVPDQCLQGLRKLCDERGALLIYDEVQCGFGRTGKLWAHEWSGAAPDIMAVAKGVGGGFPLGACLATSEAAEGMGKGAHGSTYGGNPLACSVGVACYDIVSQPAFLQRVRDAANALGQGLEQLRDSHGDVIEDVRGRGLLRGFKLIDALPNTTVQTEAREGGLLVGSAGQNVVRMAPPLIAEHGHISEALSMLDQALTRAKRTMG